MSEISYIVNSDKPYPSWIKEHRIFKCLGKIDKVFPKIGLPNYTQPIKVFSTAAAEEHARNFVYYYTQDISARIGALKTKLVTAMAATNSKERNEKCNQLQNTINIISATFHSIAGYTLTSIVENKVAILLPNDVFSGASINPIFKKGESLLKIANKIDTILGEFGLKINYENYTSYKDYSKFNVPSKEYQLTFASTGPEGAWDIATASMRGINSCQTWTAIQSRGLIGSITSKYVGVVYVSGNTDFPPYGKQMIFRMMVRLIVNKTTGAPALYCDNMYPSYNPDLCKAIKDILYERSGLPVFSSNAGDRNYCLREFFVMNEHSRTFLREGEYSYMDSIFAIEDRKMSPLPSVDGPSFMARQKYFIHKLEGLIAEKRAAYARNIKDLKEYIASGSKDGKKPEMVPAFQDLKKGQNSFQNTLNFFNHCEKDHATSHNPTAYFLKEIFKAMGDDKLIFASNKDCDIWILRNLIGNTVKEKSWAVIANGSWMKAFPSSAKRFHETILTDLKKELLRAYKE